MGEYAHPEVLVSTQWADDNRRKPGVVIVEVDVDTKAYDEGHVPGSLGWNWSTQLCDQTVRDIIPREKLEALLGSSGISNDTTIVLHGDNNNWFAAWAFWQLKIYGHQDVRIINGGRKRWLEERRSMSTERPAPKPAKYTAMAPDFSIRSYLPEVQKAMKNASAVLVDVRSPAEFTGEILSPPGLPETCQRGGHVPGAKSIPWGQACNEDGTFKSADALRELYGAKGVSSDKPTIAYCRIGERSSHTWFVLRYLLGYKSVTNYDGSWTEWGNLVGAPVERGTGG